MDMPLLTEDFKEFLRLLAAHGVDYLLVGGYAVGVHGYPRATADLDIWVATRADNADRIVGALAEFGFAVDALAPDLFLMSDSLVRLGQPPFRIELMTSIDGVAFDACWQRRVHADVGDLLVPVIGLADLRVNKRASGRHKDLADLDELPEA